MDRYAVPNANFVFVAGPHGGPGDFSFFRSRHREHVRLTWIYLTSDSPDAVSARLCGSLLALATSHGVGYRFHHTLTAAWVRIIDAAGTGHPDLPFDELPGSGAPSTWALRGTGHPDLPFDELVEVCPFLLDKDTPLAYCTRERLFANEAGQQWVEPNRQPLPSV